MEVDYGLIVPVNIYLSHLAGSNTVPIWFSLSQRPNAGYDEDAALEAALRATAEEHEKSQQASGTQYSVPAGSYSFGSA